MTLNLSKNNNFIFNSTISGVNIYNYDSTLEGFLNIDSINCISTDDNYVYMGTSSSGIYRYNTSLIESGIYNVFDTYKQYPSVNSGCINSISVGGDFLIATTDYGVDYYNTTDSTHYSCISTENISYDECFVTSDSTLYYIKRDNSETFYGIGDCIYEFELSSPTIVSNYQLRIEVDSSNFDYSYTNTSGTNIRFYDSSKNSLNYYIEDWNEGSVSTVWVNIPLVGTSIVYLVTTTDDQDCSNPINVFDFFDDFNTVSGTNWVYTDIDYSIHDSFIIKSNVSGSLVSTSTVHPPCVIEQYINIYDIEDNKPPYGVYLTNPIEGISWYYNTEEGKTFDVYFNGVEKGYYAPLNGIKEDEFGTLSIIFDYDSITFSFKSDDNYLNDRWVGTTHDGTNRLIKLLGTNSDSTIKIDWIRCRSYDPTITVKSINLRKDLLIEKNSLNIIYNPSSSWTDATVDYCYNFDLGIEVNDMVVTEGTSIVQNGNVIFMALNEGACVIEENRLSDINNRVKFYKTM